MSIRTLHTSLDLLGCSQGYIGEAQAAVTASKAGEHTGEVMPLRGVPKGDVEMAALRERQQPPTALTLKAVNPMDGHFVGSLEVTQEAAAELAEAGRSPAVTETSGHQEAESLIQVRSATGRPTCCKVQGRQQNVLTAV